MRKWKEGTAEDGRHECAGVRAGCWVAQLGNWKDLLPVSDVHRERGRMTVGRCAGRCNKMRKHGRKDS